MRCFLAKRVTRLLMLPFGSCSVPKRKFVRIVRAVFLWTAVFLAFSGLILSASVNEQLENSGENVNSESNLKTLSINETLEREFLIPRKEKVNPLDFKFILEGSNSICRNGSPYLIIFVPSRPGAITRREIIRKTYGSFAENSAYDTGVRKNISGPVRLIFMIGTTNESSARYIVNENKIYGDIIQADFVDSYYNLTVKILLGMKWVASNCPKVKYFLKVDDDIFVNLPALIGFLKSEAYYKSGVMYGRLNLHRPVLREGQWAVRKEEFPLTYYPSYLAGNSYVISGNILQKLFHYSEYVPYLHIEDVFITGWLRTIVNARPIYVKKFTWWEQDSPNPCDFYENRRFTGNRINNAKMRKLWAAYMNYETLCKTHRLAFLKGTVKAVSEILDKNRSGPEKLY